MEFKNLPTKMMNELKKRANITKEKEILMKNS